MWCLENESFQSVTRLVCTGEKEERGRGSERGGEECEKERECERESEDSTLYEPRAFHSFVKKELLHTRVPRRRILLIACVTECDRFHYISHTRRLPHTSSAAVETAGEGRAYHGHSNEANDPIQLARRALSHG